jgi:hypothetical protein
VYLQFETPNCSDQNYSEIKYLKLASDAQNTPFSNSWKVLEIDLRRDYVERKGLDRKEEKGKCRI